MEVILSALLLVSTTLTAKERDRLGRLRRRCEWLRHRIAANRRRKTDFDRAELSALEWAIQFIEDVTAWPIRDVRTNRCADRTEHPSNAALNRFGDPGAPQSVLQQVKTAENVDT